MWAWLLSILTAWSAPPEAMKAERPRAAAAVAYAYAALRGDAPKTPDGV